VRLSYRMCVMLLYFFVCVPIYTSIHSFLYNSLYASLSLCASRYTFLPFLMSLLPLVFLHKFYECSKMNFSFVFRTFTLSVFIRGHVTTYIIRCILCV